MATLNHRTGDSIFPISKLSKNYKIFNGGADRDRTCDLLNANQALSQLSYSPINKLVAVDQVGLRGLEPRTSSLSGMRSNHLSYKPKIRVCDNLVNSRFDLLSNRFEILLKKEVIQPHLPVRLPCYDFAPVTSLTLTSSLPKVGLSTSGATHSHGVTGGVYKARERIHGAIADAPLLVIPTS